MGLSSLDVDASAEEAFAPGRGTVSSEYEAAKRAAGIPTEGQPNTLNMGRTKGLGGLFGGPMYAARFKLDALSSELLDPLQDMLGKYDYIFHGREPSSLDCLAFGYLSLLYYPPVPQSWLKETIQAKYPSIAKYIRNMRLQLFQEEEVSPATVWSISTGLIHHEQNASLPWRPDPRALSLRAWTGIREIIGNVPGVSSLVVRHAIVHPHPLDQPRHKGSDLPSPVLVNSLVGAVAAVTVGLVAMAVQHRRSPREGPLIFWTLRPTMGFGEAGNILSVLAPQLPSLAQF